MFYHALHTWGRGRAERRGHESDPSALFEILPAVGLFCHVPRLCRESLPGLSEDAHVYCLVSMNEARSPVRTVREGGSFRPRCRASAGACPRQKMPPPYALTPAWGGRRGAPGRACVSVRARARGPVCFCLGAPSSLGQASSVQSCIDAPSLSMNVCTLTVLHAAG